MLYHNVPSLRNSDLIPYTLTLYLDSSTCIQVNCKVLTLDKNNERLT